MNDEKRKEFNRPGINFACGFKLKQTDKFRFFMTLAGSAYEKQDIEITYDPNRGWKSKASQITYEVDQIKANVFCFGKEKVIDQMKRVTKEQQSCVVRTKQFYHDQFTIKLDLDSDYDDFNQHLVEIEIQQKDFIVNGKSISLYNIDSTIKEHYAIRHPADVRITLSSISDDQSVRELLEFLADKHLDAKYSIGFK
jgi:hypothetical protein